jgi:hypothetical protein
VIGVRTVVGLVVIVLGVGVGLGRDWVGCEASRGLGESAGVDIVIQSGSIDWGRVEPATAGEIL